LEILPTCNLAQLADVPLLRLWNFRSDDIAAISKHDEGKTRFQKKKKDNQKRLTSSFKDTHVQEPSTATLMVLTTWCNIPTDFTSGVLFFLPQFL
jgi:hypothetical protein